MKKKKGFTLVELLAVIVILAIILVIAVPQIMDTIDSARSASLESSAKMVAAQVENQYTVSQTLGTNFSSSGDCTTAKWAGLNDEDYESCTYSIDSNGKASVTLVGKGKFEGKSICDGTRTSAKVTEESCALVCAAGTTKVVKSVTPVMPYEVKNVESCEDYLTNFFINAGAPQEIVDSYSSTLCGGGTVEGMTFPQVIEFYVGQSMLSEQELIENNVIKATIEEECRALETCFAFDNGSITGYDINCGTDVVIPETIDGVTVTTIQANAFTTEGNEVLYISNYKNVYPSKLNDIDFTASLMPIVGLPDPGDGLGITSVVIPNTVTSIQYYAFYGNNIKNLTIPSSVEYIGWNAFDNNPLSYVHLGNLDATIESCAFGDSSKITTHNIPGYVCES